MISTQVEAKPPRGQSQGRPEAGQDHVEGRSTNKGRRAFVGRSESLRSIIAVASKVSFLTMAGVAGRRPDAVAYEVGCGALKKRRKTGGSSVVLEAIATTPRKAPEE